VGGNGYDPNYNRSYGAAGGGGGGYYGGGGGGTDAEFDNCGAGGGAGASFVNSKSSTGSTTYKTAPNSSPEVVLKYTK
jgi:hypothetical protein